MAIQVLSNFQRFMMRGNLMDMAIGFTVGAAFSTMAKSLVNDVIMPPVGALLGNADFSDMFVVLKAGTLSPPPYETLATAQKAGAVTINYGVFVNNILALLLVGFVMFVLIQLIQRAEDSLKAQEEEEKKKEEEKNKDCTFCYMSIPKQATRCGFCTSEVS